MTPFLIKVITLPGYANPLNTAVSLPEAVERGTPPPPPPPPPPLGAGVGVGAGAFGSGTTAVIVTVEVLVYVCAKRLRGLTAKNRTKRNLMWRGNVVSIVREFVLAL